MNIKSKITLYSNCKISDKKGPTEAKVNGNGMNRHKSAEMRNLYILACLLALKTYNKERSIQPSTAILLTNADFFP